MTSVQRPGSCPQCNLPIPADRPPLCPRCQYPLLFSESDDGLGATAREGLQRPTDEEPDDRTAFVPVTHADPVPPPQPPRPAGPSRICPACGQANAMTRTRCERCSADLQPTPAPIPPPPPPAPPHRSRAVWLIIPVVAILAVALSIGAYLFAGGGLGKVLGSPSPVRSSANAPATYTKIRSSNVTVKASSTLPKDAGTYEAGNTLDGNVKTAWNSNGNKVGANAKVTLTYTFSDSVHLGRIDFYNGYQKSKKAFDRNSRVKQLKVTADGTEHTFSLEDALGKQTLNFDFGDTSTVEAVYRDHTVYADCAVSEVAFSALG